MLPTISLQLPTHISHRGPISIDAQCLNFVSMMKTVCKKKLFAGKSRTDTTVGGRSPSHQQKGTNIMAKLNSIQSSRGPNIESK